MKEFDDIDVAVASGLSEIATCSCCGIDNINTTSIMYVGLEWLKKYALLESWKHISRVYLRSNGHTLWPCCEKCIDIRRWKKSKTTVRQAENSLKKLVRGIDFR